MREIVVKYTPKPKQCLFHASSADDVYFGGAKGPGKSTALAIEAFIYAWEHPGSDPHLFRESFDNLEASVIKEFKEWIPKELYTYSETKHEARLKNGSVVKFRYIESEDDARRYDGRSIPWIGVDELGKHSEESIQILRSCNRCAKGWPVRFRATGNPGGKGHKAVRTRYIVPTEYGKKTYVDNKTRQTVQFIPANVYDGVLTEKDPQYVYRLENLSEKDRQAFLFGNYDIFEGMFFEEFGDHLKIAPHTLPDSCVFYGGLDHGESAPTSFGLWWINGLGKPERVWTYYKGKLSTKEHAYNIARGIQSLPFGYGRPPRYVWFDPSMRTKKRLEEGFQPSAIEYYQEAFNDVFRVFYDRNPEYGRCEFVAANNDRRSGCVEMRQRYRCEDGVPNSFYWDVPANRPYWELIPQQQHDDKDPEVYDTTLEDHICDDSRYLFMGIRGIRPVSALPNAEEVEKKKKSMVNPYAKRYGNLMREVSLC